MNNVLVGLCLLFLCGGLSLPVLAKTACDGEKSKHRSLQLKLRQGGKPQSLERLRARERNAWHKWWQCQNGKKSKPKKKGKLRKPVIAQKPRKVIDSPPTFIDKRALSIKGAFSGKKQQAWLNYYRKPAKCIAPKSTQTFAYCIEHANKHKDIFSLQYDENR